MPTGTCSIEEFLTRLCSRSCTCEEDASGDSKTLSQRKIRDRINQEAEALAKELDLWLPITDMERLGVPMPGGIENTVYYYSVDDVMIKVNNLMTSHSVSELFQRLLLHNSIFPQTAYSLYGFTGFGGGSIYPIITQPYIPNATYATHGEVLDYMESLGFLQVGDAAFSNGDITISDLRPRNVLKTPSGSIYVIDADFCKR